MSVVEPTGSETQITARIAGTSHPRSGARPRDGDPGQVIHLIPDQIHFFDAGPVPEMALEEDV